MNAAKILLLALFCAVLAACARPRYPLPEPYVAVRGQSYYWEIERDKVFKLLHLRQYGGARLPNPKRPLPFQP